jgi:hypothetical protein
MAVLDTVHAHQNGSVSLAGANPSKELATSCLKTGQPLCFYSARRDGVVYQREDSRLHGRGIGFAWGPNELTLKLFDGVFVGDRLVAVIAITFNGDGVATTWRPA